MNIPRIKSLRRWRAPLLLAACVLSAWRIAGAQRSRPPIIIDPPIIVPPRPRPILNQELQLQSQKAEVQIEGAVARTKLTQVFRNPNNRTIEGTYIFPLPIDAAVSGFAMTVNGKRLEAEILEGDRARAIYTDIVRQMRDPAILEFIDRDLVRAKIFPIAPGATQTMELEYSQTLRAENNSLRYVVPLRLPTGGAARSASVDIRVREPGGVKAAYSPTHAIEVQRDGDSARISGEWKAEAESARDFVLYLTSAREQIGVNLITHKIAGEDGYFMLLVAPDAAIEEKEIAAKDVVFVFDTSGSMSGEKIEQTRRALSTLLPNLNPADRFNIVTFSSSTRSFRNGLVAAEPSTLDAAREWIKDIKAVGGTNINEALTDAVKMMPGNLRGAARPQQIIFMTDGQPTVGETDVAQILKNVREANDSKNDTFKARLFVFGAGYDVNTRLLDTLAEENRGASDYVLPNEDIETKVGALYSKIAYPVLANPRLDWGGAKVYDVYPKTLPDLFRGSQITVFGRFEGGSRARPQLLASGVKIEAQGSFAAAGAENELLPRLWATRKIGYLLDEARRSGRTVDAEVKEEIIALSKKYGIVTPFTAGLITDDERPVRPRPMLRGSRSPRGERGPRGPQDAFGSLRDPGAMPDAGAGAVAASQATQSLREAERVQTENGLRTIAGKTFALRDGVWTDTAYDAAQSPHLETIRFGSAEYFKLLQDTKIAQWLSLGERVLFVWNGRAVKITP